MGDRRSYRDEDLRAAVSGARSWRGVLRQLDLRATSASAIRSVRQHADRLGLDYSHFTGQRRWTEEELVEAVRASRSWAEVTRTLGLAGGSSETTLKGHAVRLGLDTPHLHPVVPAPPSVAGLPVPHVAHLHRAGPLLAAAWFTLCGHDVSWPLEPCRYDLLVHQDVGFARIQVKTTTLQKGGVWIASISNTRRGRVVYGPDEIDQFFVIDGQLNYYLLPYQAVGGLQAISLSAYEEFRVQTGPAPTLGHRSGTEAAPPDKATPGEG